MEALVKPFCSTASLCRTGLPRVLSLCWHVAGSCCHLVLLTPSSGTQMSQARRLFSRPVSLTTLSSKIFFCVPLIEKNYQDKYQTVRQKWHSAQRVRGTAIPKLCIHISMHSFMYLHQYWTIFRRLLILFFSVLT